MASEDQREAVHVLILEDGTRLILHHMERGPSMQQCVEELLSAHSQR